MTTKFDYDTFVLRNSGYITGDTQEKIRNTRLLIAGAGLGAATAIAATRMGFSNFVLVDGDTVDAHQSGGECARGAGQPG
jgi:molybdopterin/thiamine biosynthesis adenylyltransferase